MYSHTLDFHAPRLRRQAWRAASICCLTLLAWVHGAGNRATAQQPAAARALLIARGLSPLGKQWVTASELDLRKRLDALEGQSRRYVAARQLADAVLQQNELIRRELMRLEALQKQQPPPSAPPGKTPGGSLNKPDGSGAKPADDHPRLSSQMPDVTAPDEQSPLQTAMIDLANTRATLTIAVLRIQSEQSSLRPAYAALTADRRIGAALDAVGKAALGPARDYAHDRRLTSASNQVFTPSVPVYRESGRYRITAVVNEQLPATFTLAEGSEPTLLAATLAQALGVENTADAPVQTQRHGDRAFAVRPARLPKVRLGRFRFDDVAVLVLPAEAEDIGSQLSARSLSGVRLRLVPEQMTLELESLSARRNARSSQRAQAQPRGVPFVAAVLGLPEGRSASFSELLRVSSLDQ